MPDIHFCIGAPLAKLEAKVVLEELTSRIPNLKLKPNQTYEFASNTSFRAPVALHVEW
jgi:cytochrome P450